MQRPMYRLATIGLAALALAAPSVASAHGPRGYYELVPGLNSDTAERQAVEHVAHLAWSAKMAPYFTGPDSYFDITKTSCTDKRCQFTGDLYDGPDKTGRDVARIRVTVRMHDNVRYGWLIPPTTAHSN